jgi:AMIN domain
MLREVYLAMEMGMSIKALKAVTVLFSILAVLGLVQARRVSASSQEDGQPLVQGISIHEAPGGGVTIDISVSGPVPYQTLKLAGPARLVVDLNGAHQADLKGDYPAQSPVLERVRASQWKYDPAVVRVVADLKGNPAFTVKRQPSGIRIELRPQAADSARNDTPKAVAAGFSGRAGEPGMRTAQESPPPNKVFPVHRFKDLSASLTAPVLPPHDRLVAVANPDLSTTSRKEPETLALVSGISIKPDDKGETMIDIASTRSVPYRVFQLTNPFRLVIDLKDARNASRQDVYQVDSPVLKRVRVGQWHPGNPPVVRVVAELEGYPIFDVHAQRPGIRVELRARQPLPPVVRNPFVFRTERQIPQTGQPATRPDPAITAAAPGNTFSALKVIGFIEKKGSGVQAVISDHANLYIVPKGDTFESIYTVMEISPNAVEVQNIKTAKTSWIPYSP